MTNPTAAGGLECVEVVITAESAELLADFTASSSRTGSSHVGTTLPRSARSTAGTSRCTTTPRPTQARVGLHTRASLVPDIESRDDRDHADDVPCVIPLPISSGHPAYLQWIYDETQRRAATC